jgi:hypothetical protein
MFQYAYLSGCLILLLVWVGLYFLRRDLRKEQIFGSLLALPFGFSEILFVPEYWNPPSIFNLIGRFGFGFEDFLLSFVVGGITAIVYEVVSGSKIRKYKSKLHGLLPYLLFAGLLLIFEVLLPYKTIYNLYLAFFVSGLYVAYSRPDLIKQMVVSGFVFGLLYFLFFLFFNFLFPNFITSVYTLNHFWGINILNVPLEEILLAFFSGSFWSVLYEYIKSYRTTF